MKGLALVAVLLSSSAAWGQQSKSMQEAELLKELDNLGLPTARTETVASPTADSTPESNKRPKAKGNGEKGKEEQKGPTEITCTKEATFDNKTRQAIFIGDVHVKDPQFTLTSQKLTAILRDTAGGKTGAAVPAGSPAPGRNGNSEGGLERAIAEGDVIIIQDKPGEAGGPSKRYIGKGQRADYDAKTGDVKLSGWPQVQQGINNQVATEASTVMYLNREGRMRAEGGTKTIIQEQTD